MQAEKWCSVVKMVESHNGQVQRQARQRQLQGLVRLDTAFGINSQPICNQLQMVGEKYVVFMVGSIVVVKDMVDKAQRFYCYPNRFSNVTALFAVSKEHKFKKKEPKALYDFTAPPLKIYFGESSEGERVANIVYLKPYKSKLKVIATGLKGIIKEMTVDRGKKMVACLLQAVQHTYAILLNYRKEKILTCTCLKIASIEKLSFHPLKQKSIILMGKNYLRVWELHSQQNVLKEESQLVVLKIEKESRFYDLSWQTHSKNPCLFVLINKNRVLVIQNDTLAQVLHLESKEDFFSICATKRGFAVGGTSKGFCSYELDKAFKPTVIMSSVNKNTSDDKIIKIHSSVNDGYFTMAATNQIGAFNFYYTSSASDTNICTLQQFFASGFHSKKINCLSTSVTKQIVASCSQDSTIKLWNYFEVEGYEKKGLITHTFAKEPLSVSMHPSGLFVAVGFADGFIVYAIVNDSIEVLKSIPVPGCKLIRYSHGGHFLAFSEKQHIFLYDSVYYQTLNLFTLDNLVQQFSIASDDSKLVATCTNGVVYVFGLNESSEKKKGGEHRQSKAYTCMAYDQDLFVGCTTEKYLTLYKNRCKELIVQFPVVDCYITALLVCPLQRALLAGTSKGTLRIYPWPLTEEVMEYVGGAGGVKIKEPAYVEVIAHSYPLVSLCVSYDESYLFSGSEDGTVLCFKMKVLEEREGFSLVKPEDRKRIAQSANDLYLQRIDKIEEKNESIKKLKFQILRSQKKLKLQKEKLDIIYRQKIDNLKKEYRITLDTNKKIKDSYIQNSIREYEQLSGRLQVQRKQYGQQIEKLKAEHKAKIEYELKRNDQIRLEIDLLHERHVREVEGMKGMHEETMKRAKHEFFEKCQRMQIKYSNFLNTSKRNAEQFTSELNEREREYESEIEREIRTKKEQIAKVKAINRELEMRNVRLTEQFERLSSEDKQQQEKFEELYKEHNDIRFENLKSDEEILKMQHQLLERLQVIESKEETCKNARYEQTTLQNFRYMLDSKIMSLEEKKTEMLGKIRNRETDLKNMFNELIKESEENEGKKLRLKHLNAKIMGLEKEIKISEGQIESSEGKLRHFRTQIGVIANSNEERKNVGRKLKMLVEECENGRVNGGQEGQNQVNAEVNQELSKQAQWMEKKLKVVKEVTANYKEMREENINAVLSKNTKLIEECNKLRKLNEEFKRNIKNYEKELSDLVRKKQKNSLGKKNEEGINFKAINKRLEEQEGKITDQKGQLASMNQQIKEMIKSSSQAKIPSIRSKLK